MEEVAPGVYLIRILPRYAINAYLAGDVLIDAGIRFSYRGILRQLRGHAVAAHALTHAHPDHQGSSHAICTALGIPLWCGAGSVPMMERGTTRGALPNSLLNRLLDCLFAGPGHPVARVLREGDLIAGFTVVETPGHAPGHIVFWRESDRTLLCGDVLTHRHPITGRVELREPNRLFTPDPALNRQSARKLAALRARVICFGHGPPLYDGERFCAFVERLPA